MTYFRMGKPHTIIGAESFHFRVRDGIGWFRLAMAARQSGGAAGLWARAPGVRGDALGGHVCTQRSPWVLYGQASRAISTG